MKGEPCAVCGHTEMNLVDGFYYCDECGTQDTNVRETIVDQKAIGDGTFAATTKRKLVKVVEKENEMSGEWYKWHAYNFVLVGLADDLITLGANPSFKTKLLWIWTRYIKMYQNKEELGLGKDKDNSITIESLIEARTTIRESISVSEKPEDEIVIKKSDYKEETFYKDINYITKCVLMSMLYLALNLDRSDIQLSHLFRFLKEDRISFQNLNKYFPEDFNLKAVPQWNHFIQIMMCTPHTLRYTTMTLIRKLDLGVPVPPDLRKILNNIVKEMCLPKEVYNLVCSLMHLFPCNYLTISKKYIVDIVRVPDYEAVVMSYVLVALKMCFGLDDCYEMEISNAVEKINEDNNFERSYKYGISSYTKRLFSFREWCHYLRARRMMLSKHCFMMADTHVLDIDDYVFMEHLDERVEGKVELTDKIAMEILDRLPLDTSRVIPKEDFKHSFTPMCTYTQVILDYCQDPDIKYLLSEDFTQYSLSYACEDLKLIDIHKSENIVVGVNESNKKLTPRIKGILEVKNCDLKMVYVKNCDNKNWMKTNPPTLDHIVNESSEATGLNENDDKDSDHGYDSNLENGTKETPNNIENTIEESRDGYDSNLENGTNDKETPKNNENTIDESRDGHDSNLENGTNDKETSNNNENTIEESSELKIEMIEEEELGKNIFDDEFEDLDCNAEENDGEMDESNVNACDENNLSVMFENNNVTYNGLCYDFEDDEDSCLSDTELIDSSKALTDFNPDTFNREKAIKELVFAACKKYKIPIPKHFKDPKDQVKTRKRKKKIEIPGAPKRKKICKPGQAKKEVGELLNAYHEHLEKDVLHQVAEQVKTVIQNVSLAQENNTENDLKHLENNINENIVNDETNEAEIENDIQQIPDPDDTEKTKEADENVACVPCEDEGSDEGEPDWRTEGDPKFDEKKYDVNQLYVKIEPMTECFSIDNDPVIEEIISKKLQEVQKNACKFMKLQDIKKPVLKKCVSSDSEDDLPLSDLQKEKKFVEELHRRDNEVKEPLIKNNVPVFKYWCRHYARGNRFIKNLDIHKKFEEELKENYPKSFYFVIHECAFLLKCSAFHMYKHLQTLEKMLAGRAKFDDFDDL